MNPKTALFILMLCSMAVCVCAGRTAGQEETVGDADECLSICDRYSGDGYKMCLRKCVMAEDTRLAESRKRCPSGFAYIPPGEFVMGSPLTEDGRFEEEAQHRVTISKGFCMGQYEVTQGLWEEVMGSNPSFFAECGSKCPVENVSWNDAQEFIKKYNAKYGGGYRLPTEAEWEYAARAGTDSAFYTGEMRVACCGFNAALDRAGWYCGNSGEPPKPPENTKLNNIKGTGRNISVKDAVLPDENLECDPYSGAKTHPAGLKESNAWGLYDMHGNVWEWVADYYGSYAPGAAIDPLGPQVGSLRVMRGGGWRRFDRFCRAAYRGRRSAEFKGFGSGFRLARTAQ